MRDGENINGRAFTLIFPYITGKSRQKRHSGTDDTRAHGRRRNGSGTAAAVTMTKSHSGDNPQMIAESIPFQHL